MTFSPIVQSRGRRSQAIFVIVAVLTLLLQRGAGGQPPDRVPLVLAHVQSASLAKVLEHEFGIKVAPGNDTGTLAIILDGVPGSVKDAVLREIRFFDNTTSRTRLAPLRYVGASDLLAAFNQRFQGQGVTATVERSNNALLLTGPANILADAIAYLVDVDRLFPGAVDETELKDAHLITRVFSLSNLDAAEAAEHIRQHYKPLNAKYNATHDSQRNVVIVTASLRVLAEIENVMRTIDVPAPAERKGEQTVTLPLYYRPLAEVAKIVTDHFKARKVDVDPVSRRLIVTGTTTVIENIRQFLAEFDREPPTILVEGTVLQVNHSKAKQVGIRHQASLTRSGIRQVSTHTTRQSYFTDFLGTSLTPTAAATAAGAVANPNFQYEFTTPGGRTYSIALAALINEGAAEIVLKPHITFISGGEGSFEQTQNIPNITTSQNGTNVNFIKTGLSIKVSGIAVPTGVDDNGEVKYQIILNRLRITDGRVGSQVTTTASTDIAFFSSDVVFESPQIVENGQLIIVGGAINRDKTEDIDRIPVLGDLPILRLFFRSTNQQERLTELMGLLRISVLHEDSYKFKAAQFNASRDLRPFEFGGKVNDSIEEHPLKSAVWSSLIIYEPEGGYFERIHQNYTPERMKELERMFKSRIRGRIPLTQEWSNLGLVKDLIIRDKGLKQAFEEYSAQTEVSPRELLIIARHMGGITDEVYLIYLEFLRENKLLSDEKKSAKK